jgi:hypothetical protein
MIASISSGMKQLVLFVGVIASGILIQSAASPCAAQQVVGGRARTEHLDIAYPDDEEAKVRTFLEYAEDVYVDIDSLFDGALPSLVTVTLVAELAGDSARPDVTVSLLHEDLVEQLFARELARAAARERVGATYDVEGYRFVLEGLAAWARERYERKRGSLKPRWLWAAYAYMEEATYLEYVAAYSAAAEEMGKEVVAAVGYAFIAHLVERHGRDGLMSLLEAMSENIDVCSALDDAGLGCDVFWDDWQAALEVESNKHDFSMLPQVHADLIAGGEGEAREVSLWVRILNPEAERYPFFLSLVIGGERLEEPYHAEGGDFDARIPLGEIPAGTKVLWDVAVWSETLQLWRRSGWQDRIVK